MRRSRLIALGYVVAGVLFITNAITGAATSTEQRAVTWGVLGVIWFLFSIYPVMKPGQFDSGTEAETETGREHEEAGYDFMFSAVLVLLLVLGVGVLVNLVV
jgi:hypothetical protein